MKKSKTPAAPPAETSQAAQFAEVEAIKFERVNCTSIMWNPATQTPECPGTYLIGVKPDNDFGYAPDKTITAEFTEENEWHDSPWDNEDISPAIFYWAKFPDVPDELQYRCKHTPDFFASETNCNAARQAALQEAIDLLEVMEVEEAMTEIEKLMNNAAQ